MNLRRALRHVLVTDRAVRRAIGRDDLARIEAAIQASEKRHRGELCFAVEGGLDPWAVLRGLAPRERALDVFSAQRVWDTEHNTGVLIYLQIADRDIEIVADRGIAARVQPQQWEAICTRMEAAFRQGRFADGVIAGIGEVSALLEQHFPAGARDTDELPNAPLVL